MSDKVTKNTEKTAMVSENAGRILPVPSATTIITFLIIGFMLFALVSHMALRFYASFLFTFYGWTEIMWVSVMMLGAFQTLIMIPLRVMNLKQSDNIQEFQEKIEEDTKQEDQGFVLKKKIRTGENIALFYIVNMCVQAVSYLTIGRLFLTDFYSQPLNPDLLYRWVPYPNYPIQHLIYYLPYPWFTYTVDFGFRMVLIVWAVLAGIQVLIYLIKYIRHNYGKKAKEANAKPETNKLLGAARKYSTGYLVFFLVLSYFLIRHFPMGWQIFYFTGNVATPNPRFNLFTAIVATITIIWLALPKIREKGRLAEAAGINEKIIYNTQKEMLKNTILSAILIGLGAFFITNQIPSAFELSIFTFEMIVLLSPLTLDKIIIGNIRKEKAAAQAAVTAELPEAKPESQITKLPPEKELVKADPPKEEIVKVEEAPAAVITTTPEVKQPVKGEIKF